MFNDLDIYFAAIYLKVSKRNNPEIRCSYDYYRLLESYINHFERLCQRTMLYTGYPDSKNTDQLNHIKKILTAKVNNYNKPFFELPFTDNPLVLNYVDEFNNRIVCEKRIYLPEDKNR